MIRSVKRITSVIAVAWGRTPVRWLWSRPTNDLDVVLQVASRHFYPAWSTGRLRYLARAVYWFMLIVWPIRAVILIAAEMRRHAGQAKTLFGLSYSLQLRQLLAVAFVHKISPQSYYLYEMYGFTNLDRAKTFMLEHAMTSLMPFINGTRSDRHIEDKLTLNQSMRARGFAVATDLALAQGGSLQWLADSSSGFPEDDLVVKPRYGLEGKGVYGFEITAAGDYCAPDGTIFTRAQLEEFVARLSVDEDYLVQVRETNHPEIADLTSNGFSTCRIVTGMLPGREVVAIVAVFKMPLGSGVADNFGAGAIASGVNLVDGTLSRAVYKTRLFDTFITHPTSGAAITGRRLPLWKETLDLARQAHLEVEGNFPFLGWDIGICENGPVIIETQATFGFILCQRPGCIGLGETDFPRVYVEWLKHTGYPYLR